MRNLQHVNGNKTVPARFRGPVRLVYETVINLVQRRARRRAGAQELARLDDRLLRDIGLSRAQVLAAAFGPAGASGCAGADFMHTRPTGPGNVERLQHPASA